VVRILWLILIVYVAFLSGAVRVRAQTPVEETLFMTFVPNVQFSPVYVAQVKGYFDAQGLVVALEHGDEPVGVDLIAAGQRNFGLISGEQMLAARANGRDVVSVYEWFQQFPVGIVFNAADDITTVEDLRGLNVGIPGRFGASYSGLTAMLTAHGMTESDIDLEEIGFNAADVFCVGGVDAAVIYLNNEPIQIANRAAAGECGDVSEIGVFAVSDSVDMVSNGLITSSAMIEADPDRVQAMVSAFDAGLRDVIRNPAEAYLLSTRFVENLTMTDQLQTALEAEAEEQRQRLLDDPDVTDASLADYYVELLTRLRAEFSVQELTQVEVLLSTIPLWIAPRLGEADTEAWVATQDVLLGMNFIERQTEVEAAFTNAFVPGEAES